MFTLDPGTTSGATEGWYQLDRSKHSWEMYEEGVLKEYEVSCLDMNAGCKKLSNRLMDFHAEANLAGIPVTHCFFVYEDFILRMPVRSTKREGLDPVRVKERMEGMLVKHRHQQIWVPQQPSDAMRVTNKQFHEWGLWRRGDSNTPHLLDARRHAIVWLKNAIR